MAVLVEGISVVILRQSIESKYPGGWRHFEQNTREKTFCADGDLVRVGFQTLQEVDTYIDHLQKLGLVFMHEEQSVDMAIVHQLQGIASPCSWLEFGHVRLSASGARVAACRCKGSGGTSLVTPEDWNYSGSLSEMLRVMPSGTESNN